MTNDEVASWDEADRAVESKLRKDGWWAAKAFVPAMKIQGPVLPPKDAPGSAYMYQQMLSRRPQEDRAFSLLQGRQVVEPPPATNELVLDSW